MLEGHAPSGWLTTVLTLPSVTLPSPHVLTFSPGHRVPLYLQNFVPLPYISVLALGCWCSRGCQIRKGPCLSRAPTASAPRRCQGHQCVSPTFSLLSVFDWWVWVAQLIGTLTFGQTAPDPTEPMKGKSKAVIFFLITFILKFTYKVASFHASVYPLPATSFWFLLSPALLTKPCSYSPHSALLPSFLLLWMVKVWARPL